MKFLNIRALAGTMCAVFLFSAFAVLPASAATAFDPNYYYDKYPDVAAAIGNDPQALLNHYFAYGYAEGRLPFYGADPCTEVQTSY